jgi:hypothetical protein
LIKGRYIAISPTTPILTYCSAKTADAITIAMAVTPTTAPLQHWPAFAAVLELELAVAPPGVAARIEVVALNCADALAVEFA